MKTSAKFLLFLLPAAMIMSCKSEKKPPVDLTNATKIEIPYQEVGGVKTIPVKLNGISMDMIFDTGCSGILISPTELITMQKNGQLRPSDLRGVAASKIADGSTMRTAEINLREIQIGGPNGITLKNKKASVSMNLTAPLLLGNGVLDDVASVEVDNIKKSIIFKRR